jgi:hypothetical protein
VLNLKSLKIFGNSLLKMRYNGLDLKNGSYNEREPFLKLLSLTNWESFA